MKYRLYIVTTDAEGNIELPDGSIPVGTVKRHEINSLLHPTVTVMYTMEVLVPVKEEN